MSTRKIKFIDLEYPTVSDNINAISIGLCDVRASNSILIEFSHDRNGWVISMPSKTRWDANDEVCDPCYKEMAFIGAWEVGDDDE